jgi:hypothetical protein
MKDFSVHNPWSVCEWGPVPHIASRLTTIIGAYRPLSTGNFTMSESTENNMMLAGIPPRTGGTSGHGLGACSVSGHRVSEGRRRCEMKGRLVAFVGVFCIAMLIASGAYAGKPSKDPKPPKTDRSEPECIVFKGDLQSVEGGTEIIGCCPNAGPSPTYEMILATGTDLLDGRRVGQLFINSLRTEEVTGYIVKFSTWNWDNDSPGNDDYFFEIRGGDVVKDRKNKVTTVTFVGAAATAWVYYDQTCDPCASDCFDPCTGGGSTCDDLCDPDCRPYPCNEEITIEDVSFVLKKTSDLDGCPVVE